MLSRPRVSQLLLDPHRIYATSTRKVTSAVEKLLTVSSTVPTMVSHAPHAASHAPHASCHAPRATRLAPRAPPPACSHVWHAWLAQMAATPKAGSYLAAAETQLNQLVGGDATDTQPMDVEN